jgi:hypothetical protein
MKKYTHIIGIDPDVEKSGAAYLHVPTRKMECSSMTFPQLIDYLQFVKTEIEDEKMLAGFGYNDGEQAIVVVEAGWLNKSNWHLKNNDSKRVASAKGNSAGRNHETGRKIVEIAKHYGFDVHEQRPLKKIWKGKDGKITAEEFEAITGVMGRTSQDIRDAGLIAWNFAELPMIMNNNLKY